MQPLYGKIILDHARNPRHPGVLDPSSIIHEELNALCGDYLYLTLRIDNNEQITDIAWDGEGCIISQGSASLLGDYVIGKSLEEIRAITLDDLYSVIDIPRTPSRFKCATLALKALITATHGQDVWHKLLDQETNSND